MARRCTLLALLALSSSLVAQPPQRETPHAASISPRAGTAPKIDNSNPPVLVNTSKLPKTVEVNITAAVTKLSLQPGIQRSFRLQWERSRPNARRARRRSRHRAFPE